MFIQEKKRGHRNIPLMLDLLHIGVGLLVVICAVLAFLDPEGNRFLFPIIFLLAALLDGVNGWFRLKDSTRDKKKRMSSILLCAVAGILCIIGIISGISIWR